MVHVRPHPYSRGLRLYSAVYWLNCTDFACLVLVQSAAGLRSPLASYSREVINSGVRLAAMGLRWCETATGNRVGSRRHAAEFFMVHGMYSISSKTKGRETRDLSLRSCPSKLGRSLVCMYWRHKS